MNRCPVCDAPIIPDWRWAGRVRRDYSRFVYAVRRRRCMPRNFIIANNFRKQAVIHE